MMSEKQFASLFASFWQDLIPTGEASVRAMNLAKLHFDVPLPSQSDPYRRGIINEIGFRLFVTSVTSGTDVSAIFKSSELQKVSTLSWQLAKKYQVTSEQEVSYPSSDEQVEGLKIAMRVASYFSEYEQNQKVLSSPFFSGCGYLDSCVGDVLVGKTLYEIKSGDRAFRIADIKQLLIYLALNSCANNYAIESVGLLNPRVGIFYRTSVADFVFALSGRSKMEVLADMIEHVSSGGVSR